MKAIFYNFLNHKKINGTLFYCFEYFTFLSEYADVDFYIYKISPVDLKMVKQVFADKYDFDHRLLDNIKAVNSAKEIHNVKAEKALFLDMHSFENMYQFIKCDILCFSNTSHTKVRSENKEITYYGTYDYQVFDVETTLKLNFNIFREIRGLPMNTAFVSAPSIEYSCVLPHLDITEANVLLKDDNTTITSLFEKFDTLYYYHHTLDTNNRIIPESFWYNKKVVVVDVVPEINDSVMIRYNDITENGVDGYQISLEDAMVKDFLKK